MPQTGEEFPAEGTGGYYTEISNGAEPVDFNCLCNDIQPCAGFMGGVYTVSLDCISVTVNGNDSVKDMVSLVAEEDYIKFMQGSDRRYSRKEHLVFSVADEWEHGGTFQWNQYRVAFGEFLFNVLEEYVVCNLFHFAPRSVLNDNSAAAASGRHSK